MKVLVTGGCGFLGKGIVNAFEKTDHKLRLMDIVSMETDHESVIGSVANYNLVKEAVKGMDAIVIAHMAGRQSSDGGYSTPSSGFDINVKGTANLLHAAHEEGIDKVVLISSFAAIGQPKGGVDHNTPPGNTSNIYSLTKALQEHVAVHYHNNTGMSIACLRVGCILDGATNKSKYGRTCTDNDKIGIDRIDIGRVVIKCLEDDSIKYEVFHVAGTESSMDNFGVRYTCERLDWKPEYDFSEIHID